MIQDSRIIKMISLAFSIFILTFWMKYKIIYNLTILYMNYVLWRAYLIYLYIYQLYIIYITRFSLKIIIN